MQDQCVHPDQEMLPLLQAISFKKADRSQTSLVADAQALGQSSVFSEPAQEL